MKPSHSFSAYVPLCRAALGLLCLLPAAAAAAQSTGLGVTLKDPTPRDPDPRTVLATPDSPTDNLRHLQAIRARRRAEILAECNQILILTHELRLKTVEPASTPNLPSNAMMTSRIADLAKQVQKDLQSQ